MARTLVPTSTTAALATPPRRMVGHATWCGTRCRANRALLGEHRSDPMVTLAGQVGGAAVVGTRTAQQATGRQHLELRINLPLPDADEATRAAAAERAMRAITDAALRALADTATIADSRRRAIGARR